MQDSTEPTPEAARTPYEFILAWSLDNVGESEGVPSPETLNEVQQALHAIDEFLVDPIKTALKNVAAEGLDAARGRSPIPEGERAVTYDTIGQLIAWTDELRVDCGYLAGTVAEITLLAHEDLQAVAAGYTSDAVLEDREWSARMRRFHGLDVVSVDA